MDGDSEQEISEDSIPFTPLKEKVPKLGVRHGQAVLLFLFLAVTMLTRSTMSIAVVAMTDNNTTNPNIITYNWQNTNIILSSFYWTYMSLQSFSGYFFKEFGLKRILLGTMCLNSIIFALIPLSASWFGSTGVIGCRMLQGIVQGFTYPACHTALGIWAPVKERSKMSTLIYSGTTIGVMSAMVITGYISSTQYGWSLVFYLFGACGIAWCILWFLLGFDSPSKHPRISDAERIYIMESLNNTEEEETQVKKLPIKLILTSFPFWALVIVNVGTTWVMSIADLEVPTYLTRVLGFEMSSNGIISASPQITQLIFSLTFAPVCDYIVQKNVVSLMNCRRLFQFLGSGIPSVALVWLAFITRSQHILAIILLNIIIGTNGLLLYASYINHVDLSPKYAGVMLGIENTISQAVGMTGPIFVQFVVTDMGDIYLWRYVFLPLAAVLFMSTLFFMIFGSAEVQWWNSWTRSSHENDKDPLNDSNKIIKAYKKEFYYIMYPEKWTKLFSMVYVHN